MKNKTIALSVACFALGYLVSFIPLKKHSNVQMDGIENSKVVATIDGQTIIFEEILPEKRPSKNLRILC